MKPLQTFCMILRFFDLWETWRTLNWIWKRYQEKNGNFPRSWHRFLRLGMCNDCVCIYGDHDESHMFLSLLYGLAIILGTYWITETVSCNATGAVPRYFELTHSHTPVYRFMLDRWIRSIYRDSDKSFTYCLLSNPFGTLTITFSSVKRLKCGIFGTFCCRLQTYDWIMDFPDKTAKNYIWLSSDQKNSENCDLGSEIFHVTPIIKLLKMFERYSDVCSHERSQNIVENIMRSVSGRKVAWFKKPAPSLHHL